MKIILQGEKKEHYVILFIIKEMNSLRASVTTCFFFIQTVTIDCKMGPWGDWVAIDGAPGNYNRKRDTLVHPLNGGQSCPPCTEYKRGKVFYIYNFYIKDIIRGIGRSSSLYSNTSLLSYTYNIYICV